MMKGIKKILVACDLSPMDDVMLSYLNEFTHAVLPDEITFIHVYNKTTLPDSAFASDEEKVHYKEHRHESIEDALNKVVAANLGHRSDFKKKQVVLKGNPFSEVLQFCETYKPGLLVTGKKHLSSGSGIIGQKLARKVNASILFVTENASGKIRKIVIPVDFQDNSLHAVQTAVELHPLLDDPEIICMHSYDVPPPLAIQLSPTLKLDKLVEENISASFDQFIGKLDLKHCPVKKVMIRNEHNSIGKGILRYLKEEKPDMVLLGAKGHTLIEHLLLGSVAENLIQLNEDYPMMIIR
jgi:nucleotide-binding universal stress UspA family protein